MVWLQLILSTCIVNLISGDEHPSPKILIVGGGASGIAAASKLFENGFDDVTILEAEDRIGGRVHTVTLDDTSVDLGGQWVHGQKGNIAWELASPFGLLDDSVIWRYYDVYDSSGNRVDRNIVQGLQDAFTPKVESMEKQNLSMSVGAYFEREMSEYFDKHPEINDTLKRELFGVLNITFITNEAADDWHDVPVDNNPYAYEGNYLVNWKEGGYSTILDVLMKKLPNPNEELPVLNHTVLNCEVRNINYESTDGPIKVTTTEGKEYLADHVIFTSSLGVLKEQYKTLFSPALPDAKINSIKGLAYGTACKVWISFKEPWWTVEKDIRVFVPIWSEDDKKELEDNPYTNWLLYNGGFFIPAHKPRLVGAWFFGKGARMLEHLPDDIVFNGTLRMLHKFLGNHYNISEPAGFVRSDWYLNKHFRGVYTYHNFQTVELGASSENLSEPIMKDSKPIILFAGEATNNHNLGTVHGAIETGFREAERIMKFYSKS